MCTLKDAAYSEDSPGQQASSNTPTSTTQGTNIGAISMKKLAKTRGEQNGDARLAKEEIKTNVNVDPYLPESK